MDGSAGLENPQKHQLADLLSKFSDVFSSVPGSAKKSMDNALLLHRKYCRSYIDDVAIYSTTWNEHLDHIAKVFKSLQEVGLKVNLEKCAFGRKSVKFLGHIVGSGKHSPDPEKVETIRKLSRPTTKSENIPKDIPWESSAEESFVRLKEELVKMPSLHTPDLSRPFLLFTDASATAIGACLAQTLGRSFLQQKTDRA
ncbi:retrovirus-related Pol polyprotein from transposon 297 [Trichonephila clavipes]|nr:retrovirus-related Pol polyprotein from transposon 297 [Trichonephila clavipes]